MGQTISLGQSTVNVNIEDILYVGKWKHARPVLAELVDKKIPMKSYGRNTRVMIYRTDEGVIGTMESINGLKTADDVKDFLISKGD